MDFSFDFQVYTDIVVKGVPLMFVVMGLVWLWGKLGAKGILQLLSSFGTGLLIGIGYMFSQFVPVTYADWFGVIVFGLGLGLVASGFYEVQKGISEKAAIKVSQSIGVTPQFPDKKDIQG